MSFKILHIIDCYLPGTMNWLEQLLLVSNDSCQHHIHASYQITSPSSNFTFTNLGIRSTYPIPLFNRIYHKLHFNNELKQLRKYIHQHKIQGIHFHFGHVAIRYKELLIGNKLPCFVSLYGFDYEYLVHKNVSTKTKYVELATLGNHFIAEGKYSRNLLIGYGIPANQVHIVHMLFNRTNTQIKLATFNQPIRLLQAATFTEKKNQIALVNALQDKHAGKFLIKFFGEKVDKHYYNELQQAIKQRNKHRIEIANSITFNEYLNELTMTHFTINLSKRSRENDTEGGCPVFLKDGMTMGVPAIATNHCDIPDLVVPGCNGFLIPENDEVAIVETLDQLITLNEFSYRIMQRNALESVTSNIAQGITRSDLLEVYQHIS